MESFLLFIHLHNYKKQIAAVYFYYSSHSTKQSSLPSSLSTTLCYWLEASIPDARCQWDGPHRQTQPTDPWSRELDRSHRRVPAISGLVPHSPDLQKGEAAASRGSSPLTAHRQLHPYSPRKRTTTGGNHKPK